MPPARREMRAPRVELGTSSLSGTRSNQLSYARMLSFNLPPPQSLSPKQGTVSRPGSSPCETSIRTFHLAAALGSISHFKNRRVAVKWLREAFRQPYVDF